MESDVWALVPDLFGTFFFAVSGCLLAAQRGFDIIGSLLLGTLTGVGGGVLRDAILGRVPTAFAEPVYFIPPVAAALVVFFLLHAFQRFRRALLVFDAGGLALFCTTGTIIALQAGVNPVSAAVLGVTTGVGGGLMRDVVANRVPQLFNPRDLYAVPAMLGAAATAVLWTLGLLNFWTGFAVAAVVFAFRVVGLRFRWHVPLAASGVEPHKGHNDS
ncbi:MULTISPECIES: TRIC cation channel family protein [unclassified Salinibacterium]|uniref:trimeric intracellular cation channel family protein n=1 Tax=unclassified Salinibacterium TaxID=2632331 RepID=UPI00141F3EDD|nr:MULTISPECIES: TRIC cation channel family protein [unclassified Salinibacterium]